MKKQKNVLIISTIPDVKEQSVTVNLRNVKKICKELNYDLASNPEELRKKNYDVIIFSYASYYFKHKPFMKFLETQKTATIGWLTNEYDLRPNGCYANKLDFVISNFKYNHKNNLVVNLNTLIFEKRNPVIKKKYEICYYGTFRPNRAKYFKKYLQEHMILSTSAKNFKKFKDIGCNPIFIKKLNFEKGLETLNFFEKTLYIEDEYTHTHYNFLSNRFYEAIQCNCLPLFDKSCINTINLSNYYIPQELIIDSLEDTKKKFDSNFLEIFLSKNEKIAIDDRSQSLNAIKNFIDSL